MSINIQKHCLIALLLTVVLNGCGGSDDETITSGGSNNPKGSVFGITIDSSNGAAISDVTVSINSLSASSDASGVYTINDITVGDNVLTATKTGYINYTSSITISDASTTSHDVNIIPLDYISATQYKTCLEILDGGSSQGDDYYLIDIDSSGVMNPFIVYCDMTNEGGGWTLFARHEDGVAALIGLDQVNKDDNGFIRSDRWVILRSLMSEGMMFEDEHSNISTISSAKLKSGNCATINDIDNLIDLQNQSEPVDTTDIYLYHNEISGCNAVGSDYTLIKLAGDRTSNYATSGAALFQGSSVKFDVWPYSNSLHSVSEQNLLFCFIK